MCFLMKSIHINIRPSKLQADINTKGDNAQLNIDGNVNYSPIDSSIVKNQNITDTITENGHYEYTYNRLEYTGIDTAVIDVSVQGEPVPVPDPSAYDQGYEQGIEDQKAKLISLDASVNGLYEREDGYNSVNVNVPIPTYTSQEKSVVITENGEITIAPDASYDGLSRVDISTNIDTSSYYDSGYEQGYEDASTEKYPEGYNDGVEDQKAKLTHLDVSANGYYSSEDGFSDVSVNVPPTTYISQEKSIVITENGEITIVPDASYDGLSKVDISTNIDTSSYYNEGYEQGYEDASTEKYPEGYDDGVEDQKSKLDSSTFTANGTYTREDGWNEITVDVSSGPGGPLQSKTVDASTVAIQVSPDASYYGLSAVNINAVDASIDLDIQPENIREGVEILGVQGTYIAPPVEPYTAVEYISNELDPHVWIDLEIPPTDTMTFIIDCSIGELTHAPKSSWGSFFGLGDYRGLYRFYHQGDYDYTLRFNFAGHATEVCNVNDASIRKVYSFTSSSVAIDGSTVAEFGPYTNTWTSNQTMYLYGMNDDRSPGGEPKEYASRYMKVYSVKIIDGGVEVVNAIPVITDQGTPGLYDTVREIYLYPNGTLEAGPASGGYYQSKTVDASTAKIKVVADSSFIALSSVNINAVTAAIDPNIIPENIRVDVSILGVTGTLSPQVNGRLQDKTVDSSTELFTVYADEPDYTSLGSVTVRPYYLETMVFDSSTVMQHITTDSSMEFDGIGDLTINPYVLDSKTVDSSTVQQIVTPTNDGLSSVTVNAVTAAIDPNIIPENIKSGVEILGVVGTAVPAGTISLQNKTVDSSSNSQVVLADSGYDGLGSVTVNPMLLTTLHEDVSTNSRTITAPQGYSGFSEVVLDPMKLQDISVGPMQDSSGEVITYLPDASYHGFSSVAFTPTKVQAKTVDASITSVTVAPSTGYDALSSVIVNAVTASIDSNIAPENIVAGIEILGVTGTAIIDSSMNPDDIGYEEIYNRLSKL